MGCSMSANETAEERRARLIAMRREAQHQDKTDGNSNEENSRIKLRNYVIKDAESIAHDRVAAAVAPDLNIIDSNNTVDKNDNKNEDSVLATKANADLKRDVERKLQILEKRTQEAIIEVLGMTLRMTEHYYLCYIIHVCLV